MTGVAWRGNCFSWVSGEVVSGEVVRVGSLRSRFSRSGCGWAIASCSQNERQVCRERETVSEVRILLLPAKHWNILGMIGEVP